MKIYINEENIYREFSSIQKSLDELEKVVNTIREKKDDEKKKLRPELIQQTELGNESPLPNSIPSTVINTTIVIQQNGREKK